MTALDGTTPTVNKGLNPPLATANMCSCGVVAPGTVRGAKTPRMNLLAASLSRIQGQILRTKRKARDSLFSITWLIKLVLIWQANALMKLLRKAGSGNVMFPGNSSKNCAIESFNGSPASKFCRERLKLGSCLNTNLTTFR